MKYIEYISYFLALLSVLLFFHQREIAPYLLALGAAGLCVVRWRERYDGKNLRIGRIMRIRHFIGVIWLIASYYMFRPGNYWMTIILIAVVLELYTLWVLDHEEKKINNNNGKRS